jgi:hypothetical protein
LAMLLKTGVSAFSLEVCSKYHAAVHQNPSQTTCSKYKLCYTEIWYVIAVVVKSKIILSYCSFSYACSCTSASNYKQFMSDINKVLITMPELYSSINSCSQKCNTGENTTHNIK